MDYPLHRSEKAIAYALGIPLRDWRSLAVLWEREGLPPIDPTVGKRYWPAVKAWFDARHGLAERRPAAMDGAEQWHTR